MSKNQNWSKEKSSEELKEALGRQVGHLRQSAKTYDEGRREEAERLAVAVYTICHDGNKNNTSALTHLGLKNKICIPDTLSAHEKNYRENRIMHGGPPLCSLWKVSNTEIRYHPFFGDLDQMDSVSFNKWWDGRIYHTSRGLKLSRKNVVYYMRSQDGGAHLDKIISSEAYNSLAARNDPTATSGDPSRKLFGQLTFGEAGTPTDGHWASMRQVAWELDHGLSALGF